MKYLIDANGSIWDPATPAFRQLLRFPLSDFDLARYAIANLYFVGVEFRSTTMWVRMRRDWFPHSAFEKIVYLACEEDPQRTVIEFDGEDSIPEMFGNVNDAISRLEDLCGRRNGLSMKSDWFCLDLANARLSTPKRAMFRRLVATWRRNGGRLPVGGALPKAYAEMSDRHVVVRVTGRHKDQLKLESWGTAFRVYSGLPRPFSFVGLQLEEQPDQRYGSASAASYRLARAEGTPRFEVVEAVVRPPDGPSLRLRYERILLPWETAGGDAIVTGTSMLRTVRPSTLDLF